MWNGHVWNGLKDFLEYLTTVDATQQLSIFLDDERFPDNTILPPEYSSRWWLVFRNGEDLLYFLGLSNDITNLFISFDNDLGEGLMEGKDVLKQILNRFHYEDLKVDPSQLKVHSMNSVAAREMNLMIERDFINMD